MVRKRTTIKPSFPGLLLKPRGPDRTERGQDSHRGEPRRIEANRGESRAEGSLEERKGGPSVKAVEGHWSRRGFAGEPGVVPFWSSPNCGLIIRSLNEFAQRFFDHPEITCSRCAWRLEGWAKRREKKRFANSRPREAPRSAAGSDFRCELNESRLATIKTRPMGLS